MQLLDGKLLAKEMRADIKQKVSSLNNKISLAVVLVGEDPASCVYVRNKIKACEEVGIISVERRLPETAAQSEVEKVVSDLAEDDGVCGILVQLPLPAHLNAGKILSLIPFEKDVDGFSPENIGRLCMKKDCLIACTPHGVMKLFERYGVELKGKKAVVIGRSDIVGKPMAMLLLNADATVTVCHSKSKNLKEECLSADIIVAAVGKAKLVTADMVKEGAVIADVGMNRTPEGKLCGDVDFESVSGKCSYITPVPGGVGPMTITMLMYNTYLAAVKKYGL